MEAARSVRHSGLGWHLCSLGLGPISSQIGAVRPWRRRRQQRQQAGRQVGWPAGRDARRYLFLVPAGAADSRPMVGLGSRPLVKPGQRVAASIYRPKRQRQQDYQPASAAAAASPRSVWDVRLAVEPAEGAVRIGYHHRVEVHLPRALEEADCTDKGGEQCWRGRRESRWPKHPRAGPQSRMQRGLLKPELSISKTTVSLHRGSEKASARSAHPAARPPWERRPAHSAARP